MPWDYTLQAGEEGGLGGGVRVTVLAVEGDTVFPKVTVTGTTRLVALEVPEARTPRVVTPSIPLPQRWPVATCPRSRRYGAGTRSRARRATRP